MGRGQQLLGFPFKKRGERGKDTPRTRFNLREARLAASLFLASATMAAPGPSKSRILAALDLTEDASPSPPSLPTLLLSRQAGGKRKRVAEYAVAPLNKRQVSGTSRASVNALPTGLLANTQSPGEYLVFLSFFHM
jgi:hypothetical protein